MLLSLLENILKYFFEKLEHNILDLFSISSQAFGGPKLKLVWHVIHSYGYNAMEYESYDMSQM